MRFRRLGFVHIRCHFVALLDHHASLLQGTCMLLLSGSRAWSNRPLPMAGAQFAVSVLRTVLVRRSLCCRGTEKRRTSPRARIGNFVTSFPHSVSLTYCESSPIRTISLTNRFETPVGPRHIWLGRRLPHLFPLTKFGARSLVAAKQTTGRPYRSHRIDHGKHRRQFRSESLPCPRSSCLCCQFETFESCKI
jgi:hypothetical protein